MKNYDIIDVCRIIENTCDKNGFSYGELGNYRFAVWLRIDGENKVASVLVNDSGYVEISNRSNSAMFYNFEDLDYPYDPDLGMAIYGLLD